MVVCDVSCGSGDDDGSETGPALSYEYIANNRAFIGGSVIYNPTGTHNQIESGTIIVVRMGHLNSKRELTNKIYDIDYTTSDKVEVNITDNASFDITSGTAKSDYQDGADNSVIWAKD